LKQSIQDYLLWYKFSEQGGWDETDRSVSSKLSPSEVSRQLVVRVEWSELSRQFMEAYRAIARATQPIALLMCWI